MSFLRGSCSKSADACPFSHSAKVAQKVISAAWAGAANAGSVPASGGSPAPAPAAAVSAAPAVASVSAQPAGTPPRLAMSATGQLDWARPVGGVFFDTAAPLPDVNVVQGLPAASALRDLDGIPAEAWQLVVEPSDGYHYLCESYVYDKGAQTLLDGGAVFSLTWEATVVAIINHAIALGKTPEDEDWPIAGLVHWGRDSSASSAAERGGLQICGIVDLRLHFEDLDGAGCARCSGSARCSGFACCAEAGTSRSC